MAEVQLRVHDLWKTFHPGLFESSVEVLKGLSLEVQAGEIFGFLGPNGAGKTTTIKAITGLVLPDAGEITVAGYRHDTVEAKRRLGFMAEAPYVYTHLSGREYLRFSAELLALDSAEIDDRIAAVLDQVTMTGSADRKMRTYSKGMLQRIALGQALLGEPELLILDEPMSGLDPVGRSDVRDLILAEKARGTTVFFSSHIIPDVETICDRVAIIADGQIRATGEVRDLVARQADAYEVSFVGADVSALATPLLASYQGSDATWVRVDGQHRDALIRELTSTDARLVALSPVRSSLEEFVLRQYQGGAR